MDLSELSAALVDLPLGGLRFYDSIGSTNDAALAWAKEGARDLSLIIADEQTAGRGRSGRKWHTPAGVAIAMSLILRPSSLERMFPARLTGLAALALVEACQERGLTAQVKWPNDVLIQGRKVAGVLVESEWSGNALTACVLGIGVNVAPPSVPPTEHLSFPATSLEAETGRPMPRSELLKDLLGALLQWRSQIGTPQFITAWEEALAFRGQEILLGRDGDTPLHGTLVGLESDGSLRILSDEMPTVVHFGEIHLRPMDDRIG